MTSIVVTPATMEALTALAHNFMSEVMIWPKEDYTIEEFSRDPEARTTNVLFSVYLEEWVVKIKTNRPEQSIETIYLTVAPEKKGEGKIYTVEGVTFRPGWRRE